MGTSESFVSGVADNSGFDNTVATDAFIDAGLESVVDIGVSTTVVVGVVKDSADPLADGGMAVTVIAI